MSKINLKDVTFIIPIMIDSNDRFENINIVVDKNISIITIIRIYGKY